MLKVCNCNFLCHKKLLKTLNSFYCSDPTQMGFFVQSILADRNVSGSLQSSSSVEFEIKKIFFLISFFLEELSRFKVV